MNYKIELIKEMIKTGELVLTDDKLIHRDRETGIETVVATEADKSNALPKEVAIKYGFSPDLNEHGARRFAYADQRIDEMRNSGDPNQVKAVDFLPKWFVFEDELNSPTLGTLERTTLNKNDDQAAANLMIGNDVTPWQGHDGAVVKDHVYLYLTINPKYAEKVLSGFKKRYDRIIAQTISLVTNNSRI
tara:strand:- start:3848 stop:4414 length:567 start_codon:yes stop_codon:yes gene_type:complete